jgi:monofunctional biosynthetic peptidoglycan transglycosylase
MKTLLFLTIIGSLLLMGFSAVFPQPPMEVVGQSKAFVAAEESKLNASQPFKDKNMIDREDTIPSEIESIPDQSDSMYQRPGRPLFTFSGDEPSWYTINDNVMGGISNSTVRVDTNSQKLTFSGNVSLENNGGFASTRSDWTGYDLRDYDGILIRVRGDGNVYRLRARTERTGAEVAYTALFETEVDMWQEVYIPFAEMIPTYRGFIVEAAGPLDPSTIRSFGLMLSDKQQGQFSLEVDWINAVAVKRNESTYASIGADQYQAPSLVYAEN